MDKIRKSANLVRACSFGLLELYSILCMVAEEVEDGKAKKKMFFSCCVNVFLRP